MAEKLLPAAGGTFLFRQESTQRTRYRGGAEPQLPLANRPSPIYPSGAFLKMRRRVSVLTKVYKRGTAEPFPVVLIFACQHCSLRTAGSAATADVLRTTAECFLL